MVRPKPLVLTILDGWGYSPSIEGNAIYAARKPNYDHFLAEYPHGLVHTSGPYVGLPPGQMGNSEVGHLNIGAGRVIYMDVTRIDLMITSGDFFQNPVLLKVMEHARERRLHIMGLLSDGGVHSMNTHLYALLKLARQEGVKEVFIHCFMDGRDTSPQSGVGYLEELLREMGTLGTGRVASVSGRYYAMDRDRRWERIERAFGAMVWGNGIKDVDPVAAVRESYERGVTDEFIEPITIVDQREESIGLIRDEDACIFFNFRADRGRQMTEALISKTLERPSRALAPKNLHVVTMTQYDKTFDAPFVLSREHPSNILANVMSQLHLRNLRVAETEKYAHVTYFFNGGNEKPYAGEEREMVASPKVATYDLKPEMSAAGVCEVVLKAIDKSEFDVIVMNFANADMVGHSGKMEPTVRAVEAVDGCLGAIYDRLRQKGGSWLITADHGNAETMIDPDTLGPHTYHTTNPVPLFVIGSRPFALKKQGILADVAPTILELLGIPSPPEMTGNSLLLDISAQA
jgi:2,3-bisphosphoglycerate-independent phosphoglycerate mutase